MSEYDDLRRRLFVYPELVQIEPGQVERLRAKYPDLPQNYFAFLGAIGWGDFEALTLYSGPIRAVKIRPQAAGLEHVLLIGDDGLGYCFGFDTRNGHRFVEIDPEGGVRPLEKSLLDMVRASLD
jgi:hypothetical protein